MSIENAKAFYQRITTDESFRIQLHSIANEERKTFIQSAGYDFTSEEWKMATAEIMETEEFDGEINDTELEEVAGGVIYGNPDSYLFFK
jgi:predicted ribosomally synthesized peptide with nif11-like leader